MSSAEDEINEQGQSSTSANMSKKRKIQRACDVCRRKKIRCDGSQTQDGRCVNCVTYGFECTYVEAAKKRSPPKGYVESLKTRIETLERLLQKFCPDVDFSQELVGQLDSDIWSHDLGITQSASQPSGAAAAPPSGSLIRNPPGSQPSAADDDLPPSDDELAQQTLTERLQKLALNPKHNRFFGKSSGVSLIQTAIDLKNEFTGREEGLVAAVSRNQRAEYWAVRPWEMMDTEEERPAYVFPDDDLLSSLVYLYFQNVNPMTPLLHRPTFERSIAEGLHMRDEGFGATLLLVCAVASRYSDDPRIFLEGSDSTHSCGWKWFRQIQWVRKSLLAPPSLYDIQFYCLSVLFMQGSSAPQACWTMVGIGIRLAQDVGAHRKKVYHSKVTVEDELWKRAFWVLVCLDRTLSAGLGRPCAIHDEDFDLDLPVECDDEYWEHQDPEHAFKQPPGKPSTVAYYISYIKLTQVLAFALRTIYSINKSKILLGFVGPQWEQHIVSELDSALNKWIDSVPDHLRWDPQRESTLFFNQSAVLHTWYYHIQILIHRPFIPSPRTPSPLSFPSLAICANAARSCTRVIDVQRHRNTTAISLILVPAFTSCVVLLLTIWGGKRSGLSSTPAKELADVHRCMEALKICEKRWHPAGRLVDILVELACVGDLPLQQPGITSATKREREDETKEAISGASSSTTTSSPFENPRNIAGVRRVTSGDPLPSRAGPIQHHPPSMPQIPQDTFSLPMYSDELGRLPVHGHLGYPVQADSTLDMADGTEWYAAQYGALAAGQDSRPAFGPGTMNAMASAGGSEVVNAVGAEYTMDQLFFDHMASFGNPFADADYPAAIGQPGYEQFGAIGRSAQAMFGGEPGRQRSRSLQRAGAPFGEDGVVPTWPNMQPRLDVSGWGT